MVNSFRIQESEARIQDGDHSFKYSAFWLLNPTLRKTISMPPLVHHFRADIRAVADATLDLLFPRLCAGCGKNVDRPRSHVCWECFRSIHLHASNLCQCCGLQIETHAAHAFVCSACREHPPAFDQARAAGRFSGVLREMLHQFKYNRATWLCRDHPPAFDQARAAGRFSGVLRELLHQFKYNRATWLCRDLVDLLHGCVLAYMAAEAVDVVAPVPLHRQKLRDRGYNQAALLAAALAPRLDRPCAADLLTRTRATPTQTRLHAAQRRKNVHNAFAVREMEWVRGRTILLVDDVMTTGATVQACARALKRAGAERVHVLVLARVVKAQDMLI